jgi:hypothetical protein
MLVIFLVKMTGFLRSAKIIKFKPECFKCGRKRKFSQLIFFQKKLKLILQPGMFISCTYMNGANATADAIGFIARPIKITSKSSV